MGLNQASAYKNILLVILGYESIKYIMYICLLYVLYTYMPTINAYFDVEYDKKMSSNIGICCNATIYLTPQNIPQTFTNFYSRIISY